MTVYEAKDIATNVEAWMATDEDCVDPFGGVAWPGNGSKKTARPWRRGQGRVLPRLRNRVEVLGGGFIKRVARDSPGLCRGRPRTV